ncbi:MAG: polyphosphate kinase 1 [Flavobacteriaceae bacterium]|nr:polyphosphate kinase 1 [Flavobacteriaceae bacterium]
MRYTYINREISWLHFNERVLQECADPNVPLLERLRFLGIFSNNLDEFFKVRYASVKRIVNTEDSGETWINSETAKQLLEKITELVIELQAKSLTILQEIQHELQEQQIYIINELQIPEEHYDFVHNYFDQKVNPNLQTIDLSSISHFPMLQESAAYIAVKLEAYKNKKLKITDKEKVSYGLIEIPDNLDRFLVLPSSDNRQYVILLDDVIRFCMEKIFFMYEFDKISAHMIKVTRDAELDIDDDFEKSFVEKISTSVSNRRISDPVRFVYDKRISIDTLNFLKQKMEIEDTDSVIPGGRYHNRRDYMSFPDLNKPEFQYEKIKPLAIPNFNNEGSIFNQIRKRDYLLYTPYQDYGYVIRFLKEAALDHKVSKIKITIYRLAKNSQVAAALINAANNGKKVTVQIEIQARFDEKANIDYANTFREVGIRLVFGVKGLKVHSKICYVTRENDQGEQEVFSFVSTGNFNESTARIYTDYTLFTANPKIVRELETVFEFFETPYKTPKFKHLIVSPHYTESTYSSLIEKEIENAKAGKPAFIRIKMNSFTSFKMVDKLYEASNAGVKIDLIIRGICCLIPGVKGQSENITAISVVDKFLEHPRVFIFGNSGKPKVYISSADWMTRNIENRVEVGVPIYQENIKKEILDTFEIAWRDNVKARVFSDRFDNAYKKLEKPAIRSQFVTYDYYKSKLNLKQ